jgi:hypothetical protein
MSKIILTWTVGMNSEIKAARRHLNRLHSELARWCREKNVEPEFFILRMKQPWCYECELEEHDPRTLEFRGTFHAVSYTVTRPTQ